MWEKRKRDKLCLALQQFLACARTHIHRGTYMCLGWLFPLPCGSLTVLMVYLNKRLVCLPPWPPNKQPRSEMKIFRYLITGQWSERWTDLISKSQALSEQTKVWIIRCFLLCGGVCELWRLKEIIHHSHSSKGHQTIFLLSTRASTQSKIHRFCSCENFKVASVTAAIEIMKYENASGRRWKKIPLPAYCD